jgi:hypothetical protein
LIGSAYTFIAPASLPKHQSAEKEAAEIQGEPGRLFITDWRECPS